MNQTQIDMLLSSYVISKEELDSRKEFKEFAVSLSDIVIDDFAKNYLLSTPQLSSFLIHTNNNMLLKKIKDFFTFVLTAPVDENYIKKIYFIGSIHYSIKLLPAKVSYGFWALGEIINKVSEINDVVHDHRILISKLLRFVEHVMNEGYHLEYLKKNEHKQDVIGVNVQNELYKGFNLHKLNMQKISIAVEKKDISILQTIVDEPSSCLFGKVIISLEEDKLQEYVLGFKAQDVKNIHNDWHIEYVKIKSAIIKSDVTEIDLRYKNLNNLTSRLKIILDETLKSSLEDGQIFLISGIKAMKKMTKLFYEKNYESLYEKDIKKTLSNIVDDAITSHLSWAIESVYVGTNQVSLENYSVVKQIRYQTENIFIGICLKKERDSSYLVEIINLLLEVLSMHLSVREREFSLMKFADKAESANKSKDMFLANMSHELRTPLNAITGFSQILIMKKETPEAVKKYVQKINIAGNNLLNLVNTILDFAKLESGKMQFNPTLSNIASLINEVQTLVSEQARKKSITLQMPNIVSLNLYIDKTLFKQVLLNLLSNAIKFTHVGGHVSLKIAYSEKKRRYIFEIKDNGIGLSKESMGKLFETFSQIENSYQKDHKGTGLGLSITKIIVEELHQGILWVESEEEKGSSFLYQCQHLFLSHIPTW